jgi:AcrR family transcriptional regulator
MAPDQAEPDPVRVGPEQRSPDQPALSRDAIVREAIAMLDADGIEALSMRKLGARLNAGATSLYRHVATKDELMELAVDEVAAEITSRPRTAPDWRAAVAETAAVLPRDRAAAPLAGLGARAGRALPTSARTSCPSPSGSPRCSRHVRLPRAERRDRRRAVVRRSG